MDTAGKATAFLCLLGGCLSVWLHGAGAVRAQDTARTAGPDTTVRDTASPDPTALDTTALDTTALDPTAREAAAEDPTAREAAAEDPTARDTTLREAAAEDTTSRDKALREAANEDTTSRDTTRRTPSAAVDTSGAPTVVDSARADRAASEGDSLAPDANSSDVDTAATATDSTEVRVPADTAAAAGPAIPSSPVLDTLSNEVFQRTLRAYLAVRDIQPAFRARYGSAGSGAADDTTYRAFQRTAEQAIRSTGLAVRTYRALLAAAQTDTLLHGVLRRGLARGGDSAFVPLDSLRPDSSWIPQDSLAAVDSVSTDEASPDTATVDTSGSSPTPADTIRSIR